jgi:asparagine synthase (glutamine-hydrolysing)
MCGLNGIFAYHSAANLPEREELLRTRDFMAARGPDGAGEWWNGDRRIGMAHRRLAIQDLSDRAAQPMQSSDGRYTVVFNGEIYNAPVLRRDLERRGCIFRTNSDTEVLLQLFSLDGLGALPRLRGMFAFGVWDDVERQLLLARDPYGIKPLYVADDGWTLRFASQVKALLAGGKVNQAPEPAGIVGFHLWGSVPEPFTLYQGIRSLPAGHVQVVDERGTREPTPYISLPAVLAMGAREPLCRSDASANILNALRESVEAHLLADVPIGVFLSAGVDSGALLGLMRDAGQVQIAAITLGFEEFAGTAEDEVPLAAEVARHYGAQHFLRRVSRREFNEDLPRILAAMDQPSIDGINTWFVSKAAREAGLKVALSGVGGDELLGGYPSFRDVPRWAKWLAPTRAVPGVGILLRLILQSCRRFSNNPKAAAMLEYGGTYAGAYLLKRALFLPFELPAMLDPDLLRQGMHRLDDMQRLRSMLKPDPGTAWGRVAALENAQYLRNQLLRDADWAGMAHSLEIRTPLVDIELLRAVSPALPVMLPGEGKHWLAAAPHRPLPAAITNRSKTGFFVPTGHWLACDSAVSRHSKGMASRSWARQVFAGAEKQH